MRLGLWAALAATIFLFMNAVTAQAQASPRAAPTTSVTVEKLPPAVTKANFNVDKATQAYLNEVSAKDRAKAARYATGSHWLQLADLLLTLAIAALLMWTRASAAMRNLAQRATRSPTLQSGLYAVQFVLVLAVLSFPLSFYEDFTRRHAYGISNLTFLEWLRDYGVSTGLQVVFGALLVMVIYAVIRSAPRTWWLWGTAVFMIFAAIGMLITPVFITPLFNTSTPMKPSPLRRQIVSLAKANGVPAKNIYVVNASRQSNLINANVSGLFGTTRISIDDTLLKRCNDHEVLAVLAHEMGHYVLGHAYVLLAWTSFVIVLGFAFVAWSYGGLTALFGGSWDVREIADPAGLPIVVALLSLYLFAAMPVVNTMHRTIEAQADIFGLNAARQPDAFAKVMLMDASTRELSPGKWEEIIFWNHPSARSRIHMAMQWKAEHLRDPDIAAGPVSPQ